MKNTSSLRASYDLFAILSLVILLPIFIALNWKVGRIVLAVPFVIFAPGYALVAGMFPQKGELSLAQRLGLSIGLSYAIAFALGFIFNYTIVGVTLPSTLIEITLFTLGACVLAYYRRMSLEPAQRFVPHLSLDFVKWHHQTWKDKLTTGMFVFSLFALLVALSFGLFYPKKGTQFTEFYVLGTNFKAEGYPKNIVANEPLTVVIGVVNFEHEEIEYQVMRKDEAKTEEIAQVRLKHGERWLRQHIFRLTEPQNEHQVTFLLYKGEEKTPDRSLHLWVNVHE